MTQVVRQGDEAQYHGWLPLTSPTDCSTNVLTNGIPTSKVGDPYTPAVHCIPLTCHGVGRAVEGSPDVIVNGFGIHRRNDGITCGAVAGIEFSQDVIANGL